MYTLFGFFLCCLLYIVLFFLGNLLLLTDNILPVLLVEGSQVCPEGLSGAVLDLQTDIAVSFLTQDTVDMEPIETITKMSPHLRCYLLRNYCCWIFSRPSHSIGVVSYCYHLNSLGKTNLSTE